MEAMPRPRPPYLLRETSRHGRVVWYVRKGDGPRIRIHGEYGSDEFWAGYHAAINGDVMPRAVKAGVGTLAWLIDRYRETSAWADLSSATRRQRENIFKHVVAASGAEPYAAIGRADLTAGRDARAETPAQARNFLDAMRGLFRWALEAGFVSEDPTAGVRNPKRRPGAGFPPWTEADIDAYEKRWPIGTKERVWLAVLLYTGLRRGDAVRLGRQHVSDGVTILKTEKSGGAVEVSIPILPVLADILRAGPTGDLAFICGARGEPLTKETFGNQFSAAAKAAGLKRKSAHGVRKIGATRAANNGATVAELEALFGWRGGGMASLYTREADRRRLAKGAIDKLARNDSGTSIPAPGGKVRGSSEKRA
jgi:integrase